MVRNLDDDLNRFYGSGYPRDDLTLDRKFTHRGSLAHSGGSCYAKHPALVIPGTELKIYGGSCLSPAVTDADVYIGFDHGMRHTARAWPWKVGEEFLFEIPDMQAPGNVGDFVKLVDWTVGQLRAGKKIHCGCIGGHGRTGTFFAALVCTMANEKDAINYVREHYCKRAIETASQIRFLSDVFGALSAAGSKTFKVKNEPATSTKKDKKDDLYGTSLNPTIATPGRGNKVVAHMYGYSIWDA